MKYVSPHDVEIAKFAVGKVVTLWKLSDVLPPPFFFSIGTPRAITWFGKGN